MITIDLKTSQTAKVLLVQSTRSKNQRYMRLTIITTKKTLQRLFLIVFIKYFLNLMENGIFWLFCRDLRPFSILKSKGIQIPRERETRIYDQHHAWGDSVNKSVTDQKCEHPPPETKCGSDPETTNLEGWGACHQIICDWGRGGHHWNNCCFPKLKNCRIKIPKNANLSNACYLKSFSMPKLSNMSCL